jgi:hypothetical protein
MNNILFFAHNLFSYFALYAKAKALRIAVNKAQNKHH